ncbi:MAG: hypothetical protein ACOYVF_11790, partial [Candidatus Zixiibacteriota bacterium]
MEKKGLKITVAALLCLGLCLAQGSAQDLLQQLRQGYMDALPDKSSASTNLSTAPRPEPMVLTLPALRDLAVCFLALPKPRRKKHA